MQGRGRSLYTPEERERRDRSPWTLVQGLLAPLQFAVFLVSLGLVLRFLFTGEGWMAATLSIVAKTGLLYAIMITGSIWAKAAWGKFWVWDEPTLVSFLIVFLLYATYQPLRFSIEDPERQSRYAAVFAIVAGAFVPLRISAIAAVGMLGDGSDSALLDGLANGKEPRLHAAAKAALKRINGAGAAPAAKGAKGRAGGKP